MFRSRLISPCALAAAVCFVTICPFVLAQFETRANVSVPRAPTWMAVGDFNRDGKLDLVVAGFQPGTTQVSVLLGKGDPLSAASS